MRLSLLINLFVIANAIPIENNEFSPHPLTDTGSSSTCHSVVNSITTNFRNVVQKTMNISDLVINGGDTSRTRGIGSWFSSLFSCFSSSSNTTTTTTTTLNIQNDEDFQNQILKSSKPVLVMYTCRECRLCNKMDPTVKKYVASLKGKALYAFVNVDQVRSKLPETGTAERYPSFQVFKENRESKKIEAKGEHDNGYKKLLKDYMK